MRLDGRFTPPSCKFCPPDSTRVNEKKRVAPNAEFSCDRPVKNEVFNYQECRAALCREHAQQLQENYHACPKHQLAR